MNQLKLGLLVALLAVPGSRSAAGDDIPTTSIDTAAVVEGNNRFAFDLYARLRARTGNVCVSPFSLATGLTVVSAGARGKTAEQFAHVLHHPVDAAAVHRAYGLLLDSLSGKAGPRGVSFRSANSLWGAKGSNFLPEYLDFIKRVYKSSLAEVDFADDPEQARRTVNAWVMEQTGGKVTELFKPGDVHGATQFVLANVLTFQGNWSSPFKTEQTASGAFRTSGGENVQVPFMHQTGKFRIAGSASGQALELPYTGHDVALVLLLPHHADGLAALETQLASPSLAEWLSGLKPVEVTVSLPRFTVSTESHLKETLAALGMQLAFRAGAADFSGLCSSREPFALTDVTQHISLEMNESGTEAVAATAVRAARGLPSPAETEFRADHPFIFLLRDQRSGAILFLGRLTDPRS